MAPDEGLLEMLRRRLSEVESSHRADRHGAAEAFWASLGERAPGSSRDRGVRRPGGRGPAPARPAKGLSSSRRAPGPALPASAEGSRRGLWSHVAPREPIGIHPSEMHSGDAQAIGADGPDAGWLEAVCARGPLDESVEPVAVKLNAAVGRSLAPHPSGELARATEHIAGLRAQHDVMLLNVVAELEARGEESPGGLRRADWLRSLDPTLTAGQAKDFVTVARAVSEPQWRELGARLTMQHITVGKAARLIDLHRQIERVADPDELATAVKDLLRQAPGLHPEDFNRLVRHHTEQTRPPKDDGRVDEGRRASRGLWFSQPAPSGMVTMRGLLDPEAAAVIKSAVDPLSIPCPSKDKHGHTIGSDPRSPAKRRADALLEIVERGVAAGDGLPSTDKAKVVVTVDHDVLAEKLRGTGLAMTGDVLSAEGIRRLACDAAIIPMVLGTKGEPLDVGRERRLVTGGLRTALWERDRGCSFPGCTCPPQWTDAHHVRPWWGGGRTSLTNLALLCRRHHTHVHRHGLTAIVTPTGVTWYV